MVNVLRADGSVEEFETKKLPLEQAQALVGGYVERVVHGGCVFLCNEEGLIKGLPFNLAASLAAERQLVGDVVVLPGRGNGGW